jgi:hypothetical protein
VEAALLLQQPPARVIAVHGQHLPV